MISYDIVVNAAIHLYLELFLELYLYRYDYNNHSWCEQAESSSTGNITVIL